MKMQRLTHRRSSAILMLAFAGAGCGADSSGDGTSVPPFGPGEPGSGQVNPPGDMPGVVTPPTGMPTPPNGEGNPNDIPLGPPGSPTEPAAQPGGPIDPTAPEGPQSPGTGFATVENLDRGVVAVVQDGGNYVGWRMLGYEYNREAPESVSYNLYRDGAVIANVTDSTNFLDADGSPESSYAVSIVVDGVEGPRSEPVQPWAQNFLRVPLQPPSNIYSAHDSSLGDADGDGKLEVFMLWQPNNAQDNANAGVTSDVFIDALRLDGTRLWRINLGPNIRAGEHYTQFLVMDGDGDGRAELAVKTAPGTRDSTGEFLRTGPAANANHAAIHRNGDGYVLAGEEFYTVFSGLTGEELQTVAFDVPRGPAAQLENTWGDGYGNRVDRFLATGAYLDDSGLPSFVIARGYYERSTLTAWNWRDGQLTRLWRFDSNETGTDAQQRPFSGQGAHSINVANADADPQQEIIYGAMSIDNNGQGLCSTGMNHGDALHTSDFLPDRPGIEVFMPTESRDRPHWTVRDGATCETILQSTQTGADVGRANAADVVASPGAEFWASSGNALRSFQTGQFVGGPQPTSQNFLIWWDADELRELEDGTPGGDPPTPPAITKVGSGTLLTCAACLGNNGSKNVPNLVADLIGDWREEVIWREANNSALRIYTTTDVTERRIYTLMHDPQYRVNISFQNVAYNQPPHPGFFIGGNMPAPPTPDIRVVPRLSPIPQQPE